MKTPTHPTQRRLRKIEKLRPLSFHHSTFLLCLGFSLFLNLFLSQSVSASVLMRDDFNGNSLNTSIWDTGTWTLGRTRLGNTPEVSGGIARLQFDTHDPTDPGNRFVGSEIYTSLPYALGAGLEFEASIRVPNSLPDGLITSFFSYTSKTIDSTLYVDEIDFEFLTNNINASGPSADPVLTTAWSDWNNGANTNNWRTSNNSVSGLDLNTFTKVVIRWLPNRVEWYVNDALIQTETEHVPDDPTQLRFNFWATDNPAWTDAYSAALQPEASSAGNSTYFYEVDYVEIRSVPEPTISMLVSIASFCLAGRRTRRKLT